MAVFEKNGTGYLSLLSPATGEVGLLFGNPNSSVDGCIIYNNVVARSGLQFRTGTNTTQMTILANGNVGIGRSPATNALEVEGNASKTTAGSWLANSDARIKTDITTVTKALETLDQVRLVSFRYTDAYRAEHPAIANHSYLNVVAQEFAHVFPEYVKSSGERLPDGSAVLQVDTYPLTIYSAAAVQELNRKLDEKTARLGELSRQLQSEVGRRDAQITELRQRLEKLEARLEQRAAGN